MNRRIRTIKPEFVQSESMGRISREARLLFILLWTQCDDAGRTRASSRMLASVLYPYDDDAPSLIGKWLDELEREGCIERYAVDGDTYLQVCKWLKHQRIDRPSASRLPDPREGSRVLASASRTLAPDQDQDQDQYTPSETRRVERSSNQTPPSPTKAPSASGVWGAPVQYLTSTGLPERHARSLIGRWLKGREPEAVLAAITDAQLNAAVDPTAYITKLLGGTNGKQGQHGRRRDPLAELREFQRELTEREAGVECAGEVIDA